MLAVCLVHTAVVTICVMVPSILPMVAWRVALGCSCIWLLYVALTTAHTGPKRLAAAMRQAPRQCANIEKTGLKSLWPVVPPLFFFLANQRSVHREARFDARTERLPAMRYQVHCACALCRAP